MYFIELHHDKIFKNEVRDSIPSDHRVFLRLEIVDDPPNKRRNKLAFTYRLTYESFTVPSPIRYYQIYLDKFVQWSALAADALLQVPDVFLSSKLLKFTCSEPAILGLDTLITYRNKTNVHFQEIIRR